MKKKKTKNKGKKQKTCFVISRIKDEGSLERWHADRVLNQIIKPALRTFGYKVERSDKVSEGGSITESIIKSLLTADLVVADLTGLNPNVMYELGIRQAWYRALIPIALRGENLSFDIAGLRTLFYDIPTKKESIEKARTELSKFVREIHAGKGGVTVFSNAISEVGKEYSMDRVYDAFIDGLTDMHKSLESAKSELSYPPKQQMPQSPENIAKAIRDIFDALSHKIHVFNTIAKGPIFEPEAKDEWFMAILDETRRLAIDGVKIDKLLTERKFVKKTQSEVLKQIDIVMKKVADLAVKCKKHKQKKTQERI